MSKVAQISGQVQVGESGSTPELIALISSVSGTITAQSQGKKIQAASTGPTALAFPGFTSCGFLWLRGKDAVTGVAKNFIAVINGVTLATCSELLMLCQTSPITAVSITTEAGNSTEIEYVSAGV